jgi:hypothetical protein
VPAFLILADELRAHGAPAELVARALASADDERRHAALAVDVHEWTRARLPIAARRRVDAARQAARAALVAECAVEPDAAVRDVLGLPEATRAVELARRI